ncbi:helix-turn-helix domain-containing protein [Anaerovorax odorimutans]|uniref:Helix-turn-helix domain-containing protein n=1 Tax=Anaerovorax odorimutans TaxID=109327 RepID=A0ABT1RPR5_9FIRM|nr:helix-turn-helix domain-containing protein [Anaerovorax odorimutans]MCQ4637170.1 helix-turn-helix domain-containing protein [Anaerovorax odorimutans]
MEELLVYTPEQVAKVLQTRKGTILDQCKTGIMPAYREGANWKIPVDSLREYLKDRARSESKARREQER